MPVDGGFAEAADGVGEIDCVGLLEVLEGEDLLRGGGVCGEKVTAVDAGEQAAGDGRREETAVFLREDVVDGPFSDFAALIQEQDIIIAGLVGGLEGVRVERAVCGFVEVHGVLRIDAAGGYADAEGMGCGERQGLGGDLEGAVGLEEEADFAGEF